MNDRPFNVLFLCTGNSARSIFGEALIKHWAAGKFHGYSAGSHPRGEVHPLALEYLHHMRLPTEGLRSKSWDEFATRDAPPLDFVFTVCDRAAGEMCPAWPGQPMTARWSVEDPAAVGGTQQQWAILQDRVHHAGSANQVVHKLAGAVTRSDQAPGAAGQHRPIAS